MNFKNTILITDADGTLLTNDRRILDVDKKAISEFIAGGGLFTIATGRGVALARAVVDELNSNRSQLLNIPAIVFNGAAVYDFSKDEFLWKCVLDDNGRAYVNKIKDRFPNLAMEILINDDIFVTGTNKYEEDHLEFGMTTPIRCDYDEVPNSGWIKVLLVDDPEVIDEVVKFAEENPCESVHTVRSSLMYYEVLPGSVNKWTGIKKLVEILGLPENECKIITVGDYMNDLEMILNADIGIAPENAQEAIKNAADIIVCNNNEGIIQDILLKLRRT